MNSEATSLEPQPPKNSEFVPEKPPVTQEELRQRQIAIAGLVVGVIILLALLITAVIYLSLPDTNTERIRDIMIIIMALEFMFLGIAMLVLIVQLATLINLLQNEVIPIIESTNETANTLRGTTEFLSDHLTEPVIKLNQYLAGLMRLTELIGLTRKR
ncbi:MAG: hypothetical protein JSV42_18965 [Chloroflexota bacterium]|nr:MAG: hypothetical protein JSV42_18965 [Chloroflexota bacterium]